MSDNSNLDMLDVERAYKNSCDGECAVTRKLTQELCEANEQRLILMKENDRLKNIAMSDDVVISQEQARFCKMLLITYKNRLMGSVGDIMQCAESIQRADDFINCIRLQLKERVSKDGIY